MSYDIWLEIDTGRASTRVSESFNYTYNCAKLFIVAFGHNIKELDGLNAVEARERCSKALIFLVDPKNKETCESLNPPNGWGDYLSATQFIMDIWKACMEHPLATVKMSY